MLRFCFVALPCFALGLILGLVWGQRVRNAAPAVPPAPTVLGTPMMSASAPVVVSAPASAFAPASVPDPAPSASTSGTQALSDAELRAVLLSGPWIWGHNCDQRVTFSADGTVQCTSPFVLKGRWRIESGLIRYEFDGNYRGIARWLPDPGVLLMLQRQQDDSPVNYAAFREETGAHARLFPSMLAPPPVPVTPEAF